MIARANAAGTLTEEVAMIGGSTASEQLSTLRPWSDPAPAITRDERLARLHHAQQLLEQAGVGALVVGAGASLRYFAGITWGASERLLALIIPSTGRPIIICPAFEAGSLEAELQLEADLRLWQEDERPAELVASALAELSTGAAAIDPAMAFLFVNRIRDAARQVEIVDGSPFIDGCRMAKSAAELKLMRQAKQMTLEVQRRAALILREGISTSEVRRFIDDAHRAIGAAGSSFCIAQFGASSAYPHGLPGECYLREGDIVLIDTGCTVDGYYSDITRTYVFGQPTQEQRSYWDLEHAAQQAAFDAVAPGIPCEAIDAAARHVLEGAGLGPDYSLPGLPHRTGHGIGLSVHEPAYLVRGDHTPLAPGMCFSNEPMIVLPHRFGVRLEDHFYVTDEGAEWFTARSASIDRPF